MTTLNGAADEAVDGAARPDIVAQAQRLLALGYPPVPVLSHDAPAEIVVNGRRRQQTPGKQPHGALWHDKERAIYGATPASVADWPRLPGIEDCTNLGIACGVIVCVDIDVYEPALAEQIEKLAVAILGETQLRRYGQRPKLALVYRSAEGPLAKIQTPELVKGGLKAKVEILGQGYQFVAFGIHPDTRAPYEWPDASPETFPAAELPTVTREQVETFVCAVEALLRAHGYRTRRELEAEQARPEPPPKPAVAKAGSDASPFRMVNEAALQNLDAWVSHLFPSGAYKDGRGVWRVPSSALGRDREEDLSIAPSGIVDFGEHDMGDPQAGKRTPIDLVIEHGGAPDPLEAARWLADRLGRRLEDFGFEARKARKGRKEGPQPTSTGKPNGGAADRVVIRLTEEHVNENARICARLLGDEVFLRGPMAVVLVRVEEIGGQEADDAEAEPGVIIDGVRHARGALILAEPTTERIQYRLNERARFERHDRRANEWQSKSCPTALARLIIGAAAELRFRPCAGIVAVPLFVRGEVIATPGYHRPTGSILELQGRLLTLAEHPTRADARRALVTLLAPFRGYIRGKSKSDRQRLRSAFAAAVLTAILRPSLQAAPAILLDANVLGAGKGKAARGVAVIATGRYPSIVTEGHSDEETEKRLASAILSGTSAILLDNLQRTLASSTLESGLTEGRATIRLFGKLVDVTVPCNALVLITANKAALRADMLRRVLPVRIVVDTEEPERRRFAFDPYEEARRHRLAIIAAGLTIAKAWWAVRETARNERGVIIRDTTLGSFEQWADLVAGPVEWLTGLNPVTLIEERKAEDPRRGDERTVITTLAEWQEKRGGPGWTTKEAVGAIDADLWAGVIRVKGERPDNRQVGNWLRARRDRVFGDLQLTGRPDRTGLMQWTVRRLSSAKSADSEGSADSDPIRRAKNGGDSSSVEVGTDPPESSESAKQDDTAGGSSEPDDELEEIEL